MSAKGTNFKLKIRKKVVGFGETSVLKELENFAKTSVCPNLVLEPLGTREHRGVGRRLCLRNRDPPQSRRWSHACAAMLCGGGVNILSKCQLFFIYDILTIRRKRLTE